MAYSSSASATGAGSVSITWPAVAIHNRAYIVVTQDGAGGTFTAPSGFTQIATANMGTPDGQCIYVWEKKDCTGSETGAIAVNTSNGSTGDTVGVLLVLSGRDNTAAATFVSAISFSSAANATPISMAATSGTAVAGDDLISAFATDQTVAADVWNFTAPSGFTERQDVQASSWASLGVSTQNNVSAGAVGTVTSTATRTSGSGQAGWLAYVIAVPAAASSVTPALVGSNEPSPVPRKRLAARVDAWIPLPTFVMPAVIGVAFSEVPRPPARRRAADAGVTPYRTKRREFGFTGQPEPRQRVGQFDRNTNPFPTLVVPAIGGWVSFDGPLLRPMRTPSQDWQPLPGVTLALASPVALDCQSPTLTPRPRFLPDGWAPLPVFALALTQEAVFPAPPVRRSPWVDPWAPLPAFGLYADQPAHAPSAPPRRPPSVDAWLPLPIFAIAAGQPSSSPAPTAWRAPKLDTWAPLATLAFPDQAFQAPLAPVWRAPSASAWLPLPGVNGPTASSFGWECASPLPARPRPAAVAPWATLPALIAVTAVGSGPECTAPAPRRPALARVDAWAPLPAYSAIAPTWAFSAAESPARRRVLVDSWAALAPIVIAWVPAMPETLGRQRRAPLEQWGPLPTITVLSWAFSGPERQAPKLRALAEPWAPIGPNATPPLGFQATPAAARQRRYDASAWGPNGGPYVPLAGWATFDAPPVPRRKSPWVDPWAPLPAFVFIPYHLPGRPTWALGAPRPGWSPDLEPHGPTWGSPTAPRSAWGAPLTPHGPTWAAPLLPRGSWNG